LNDPTLSRLSTAANWLQRLHQCPEDERLLEKCQRWLDAATENVVAFERMETVWQAVGLLLTPSPDHCIQPRIRRRVPPVVAPVKQPLARGARIFPPPAQA
jgi:ferric-dicitrate binding protein FerR (iron transport regulator)